VYGRERQGISKLFDKLGKEELLSTEKSDLRSLPGNASV
jgi:hypothetical protein